MDFRKRVSKKIKRYVHKFNSSEEEIESCKKMNNEQDIEVPGSPTPICIRDSQDNVLVVIDISELYIPGDEDIHKEGYIRTEEPVKKALLIGINYIDQEGIELRGCINDVIKQKEFLINHFGFTEDNITLMTEEQVDENLIPTTENIIVQMVKLVHRNKPGDSFFFHFSGHGGQVEDIDEDEDDGFDETIIPVDANSGGYEITDDLINAILVQSLKEGVKLTAIFDSCHSGSVMDLPFTYNTKGHIKVTSRMKEMAVDILAATKDRIENNRESIGIRRSILKSNMKIKEMKELEKRNQLTKGSLADVIMLSGCKDDQNSKDYVFDGERGGALSHAFRTTLTENPNQTYQELLNNLRDLLYPTFRQLPQLAASHEFDIHHTPFTI
ncbi:unnamed protein product [Cunninghamella echinulata]